MKIEEHDQLRRAVREAVFRAGRLRLAGRREVAEESLAAELVAAQARLGAGGTPDAAGLVHQWTTEDETTFALANLISELVGERLHSSATTPSPLTVDQRAVTVLPPPRAESTVVPGLADLLEGMLTEERQSKRRPPERF